MALQGTRNIITAIMKDPTIVKEVRVSVEVSDWMPLDIESPAMKARLRRALMEEMVRKLEEEGLLNMASEHLRYEPTTKRFTCSLFVVDLF